ncbi:MAG: hypothetical protein LLF76_02730 [Planctomycetaceae bacterium]|nr:hypothetical protein [Planctomycetaceae bacterium]
MPFSVPNPLTAGQKARAIEVMENFQAIGDELDAFPTLGALKTGAISKTEHLTNGIISLAKLAPGIVTTAVGATPADTELPTAKAVKTYADGKAASSVNGDTQVFGNYLYNADVWNGAGSGVATIIYKAASDTFIHFRQHLNNPQKSATDIGTGGMDDPAYVRVSTNNSTYYMIWNTYGNRFGCVLVPKNSYVQFHRTQGNDQMSITYTSVGAKALTLQDKSWI